MTSIPKEDGIFDVGQLPKYIAITLSILNLVSPGMGTILGALLNLEGIKVKLFWMGILQLITGVLIIGFIFSIVFAFLIFFKSTVKGEKVAENLGDIVKMHAVLNS